MNEQHDRSIITSIRKMSGTFNADQVYLVTGLVKSVNEDKGTCVVEAISGNSSTEIQDVEFQAVVSDGVLIIPKLDSEVKVLFSKYTDAFIVQYSEVDKIYVGSNLTQFDIDNLFVKADLVEFNNGSLGGMVKVKDLTTKLNNLENDINQLKTLLTSLNTSISALPPTTPILASILASLFVPFSTYGAQVLTPTQRLEIENTKIKQ